MYFGLVVTKAILILYLGWAVKFVSNQPVHFNTLEWAKKANVRFLKPYYLLRLANEGGTLLRRQEVEERVPDAYWDISSITSNVLFEKQLLVVSHCWESMQHCDPTGSQLQKLAKWLTTTQVSTHLGEEGMAIDKIKGIFIDFSSLHQYPRTTVSQQECFKLATENMQCLYTAVWAKIVRVEELEPWGDLSKSVEICKMSGTVGTMVMVSLQELKRNDVPFIQRGWCIAERCWMASKAFGQNNLVCGSSSPFGLMSPDEFDNYVDSKGDLKFTHRSDVVPVKALVRQVFEKQKASMSTYTFNEPLQPEQVASTFDALCAFTCLANLHLENLRIWGVEAAAELARRVALSKTADYVCIKDADEPQLKAMVEHLVGRWATVTIEFEGSTPRQISQATRAGWISRTRGERFKSCCKWF